MGKSIRIVLLSAVALSLHSFAVTQIYAATSSDVPERIHSINFETFNDGIPVDMKVNTGAITGESNTLNLIEQDTTIFVSGRSSLRITATAETDQWRSLSVPIPDDVKRVTVTMMVKGEDLHRELNQFGNRYGGFWYEGLLSSNSNEILQFPAGTFDWTEFTVSLDIEANMAEEVRFTIFSSISGSLWIDNLVFTYDEECPEAVQSIDGPLASYIAELNNPTTFSEVFVPSETPCPDSISEAEALEDVEMMRYLFENAYSGYAYWESNGVDFSAVCDSLNEFIYGNEKVAVVDIERILVLGLARLQDGHFSITGHDRHRFLVRKAPFFTDVLVEKSLAASGDYRVVRSNYESVQPGMLYAGSEENLLEIPSRSGVEQFQLGVFTSGEPTEEEFQFISSSSSSQILSISLPLHPCRLTEWTEPDSAIFSKSVLDGVDLIRISSFRTTNHEEMMQFVASGSDLTTSEKLIVNLMGNGGGSSRYARDFVVGFNEVAHWRMYFAVLWSPAIIGSYATTPVTEDMPESTVQFISSMQESLERLRERPMRGWLQIMDDIPPRRMGNFDGMAVFMMDRGVASSGEALVDYSKSVPGAVIIGENSAGVGTFGEVHSYGLPNSLIRMRIPSKLFLMPGFEEGTGFLPDYWLDSSEPVEEVVDWLNNPDTYQFELPISP